MPKWKSPSISEADLLAARFEPCYPVRTAAAFVGMNPSTLKTWILGRDYPTKQGPRRFEPLIEPDGDSLLSFANLVEAHVLLALRKDHRIDMARIRRAIRFVARHLGIERPLINARFQTDGVDLFVRNAYGEAIAASEAGQRIFRAFEFLLKRVEYDEHDVASRLFPLSRRPVVISAGQPVSILIDPLIAGGLPVLYKAGVPTRLVLQRFNAGEDAQALAADYGVDVQQIEEALRWEFGTRLRSKAA